MTTTPRGSLGLAGDRLTVGAGIAGSSALHVAAVAAVLWLGVPPPDGAPRDSVIAVEVIGIVAKPETGDDARSETVTGADPGSRIPSASAVMPAIESPPAATAPAAVPATTGQSSEAIAESASQEKPTEETTEAASLEVAAGVIAPTKSTPLSVAVESHRLASVVPPRKPRLAAADLSPAATSVVETRSPEPSPMAAAVIPAPESIPLDRPGMGMSETVAALATGNGSAAAPLATTEGHWRPAAGNPRPVYPAQARRRGIEGRVVLRATIDARGAVTAVEITSSSGDASLDAAAREAVERWRFTPSAPGQPAAGTVMVPVAFQLTLAGVER